jgi:hypothetical protein
MCNIIAKVSKSFFSEYKNRVNYVLVNPLLLKMKYVVCINLDAELIKSRKKSLIITVILFLVQEMEYISIQNGKQTESV